LTSVERVNAAFDIDIPGSTTDLGQSQTDSPDLTLVAQAILSDELQLRVPDQK
jgi:hypothetical protein